jgi:Tfp pilus assembly protein PilV
MTRRHKTMKGGFWDGFSLNNAWEQTKKASSSAYNSAASVVAPAPAPMLSLAPAPTSVIGGRRKRKTSKRGGYSANTPINGLASTSASFSGKTTQPQVWAGGRTRRRRHKHSTSCKHKRHRKH